jgi:hypothetical protein
MNIDRSREGPRSVRRRHAHIDCIVSCTTVLVRIDDSGTLQEPSIHSEGVVARVSDLDRFSGQRRRAVGCQVEACAQLIVATFADETRPIEFAAKKFGTDGARPSGGIRSRHSTPL